MENLLFIDVEATGTGEEDRLLQVAYRLGGEDVNELFKPSSPIKLEAMAVHHITEKMIADMPPFSGSPTKSKLSDHIAKDAIFVAHNAKYDLGMFAKEGLIFPRFICTLKLARHIDPGDKYESHQLQYLRYFYGIEIEAVAHDAFGDIVVLEQVFSHLYADFVRYEFGADVAVKASTVIERMMEVSKLPSLIKGPLKFGKHVGKTLETVKTYDRGWLEWLLSSKLASPEGEEDWIFTLRHHLKS